MHGLFQVLPATDGENTGIAQSGECIVEPFNPVIEGVVVRERHEPYARLAEGGSDLWIGAQGDGLVDRGPARGEREFQVGRSKISRA